MEITLSNHRAEIGAALEAFRDIELRNFNPLSTVTPRQFAESIMRMPDAHGATRLFSFGYAPYQLEAYLELFNPRNKEVAMMMFSRGGKSRIVLTALGYIVVEHPCRIGVMWPTIGQAQKWSKDDLSGELIDVTPEVLRCMGTGYGQRKSSSTMLHKVFPGGIIDMIGANAPGDIRRMKARFLYGDEIDAITDISSDEGDQLAQFKKRGSEFPDTIEVYCSYPSLKNKSRIESKLLNSDYRQWFVTCLHCGGEPFVMHRNQLRYDKENVSEVRFECPRCKALLDDKERYAMMMGGDPNKPRYDLWRATRPYNGRVGFQANSMLWPHPVDLDKYPGGYLQILAEKEIDIEKSENPERSRRVMVNTDDAETFEAACDIKPSHSTLFLRREKYDPHQATIPAGVLWLAFGADVQSDRVEMEVIGFGARGHTWGLGYHILRGTPMAPPTEGVWAELDRIVSTSTFAHPSGKTLRIEAGLIDRGYKPDNVLLFTRHRAARGIFASRGATSLSKPIVRAKPMLEGNPRAKVWEIGTNEAKDIIYQRLERDNKAADGFMHYPDLGCYSEQYFKMLVAEDSDMQKAGDGKFYRCFTCAEGVRNEALDIRVLALAIERIRKPNYAKLAEEMGGEMVLNPIKNEATPTPALPPRRSFVHNNKPGRSFIRGWK